MKHIWPPLGPQMGNPMSQHMSIYCNQGLTAIGIQTITMRTWPDQRAESNVTDHIPNRVTIELRLNCLGNSVIH
jgi:hypothetical protein